MNRYTRLAAALAAVASLSACATVTRGTKQQFDITSEPTNANVALSLGQKCVTPCHIKLKRREPFVATVTKDGYESQQVNVRSKVHGGGAAAGVGNVLIGGLIGVGIDASTGAMNDLDPNPLNVTLKPVVVAIAPTPSEPTASAPAAQVTATSATVTAPATGTPQ
jgi:hypothetical protein